MLQAPQFLAPGGRVLCINMCFKIQLSMPFIPIPKDSNSNLMSWKNKPYKKQVNGIDATELRKNVFNTIINFDILK